MSREGKRQSGSSRARASRAIVLLIVIAACLVAVLVILPTERQTGKPGGPRSGEAAPPQSSPSRPVEPQPPQRPAEQATASAGTKRQERPIARARIAVVIDDVGYNLEELDAFLDFSAPITLSVLPNLPHTEESARRIAAAGKELLLHLPMEAENGNDPGPGAILTSQADEQIRRLLETSFAQVPQAAGMNNHMGSRATADGRVMNVVMDYLKSNRLYFLDSRTTTETLGPETAEAHAVPYLERDIFLDNDPEAEAIQQALEDGIEVARKKGSAILIGHVRNPQIVEAIGRLMTELDRAGVELVFLSELLEEGSR
jgi:polysaccharide deacetylase 2 family uncharacterized protein YibQ